MIPASRESLEGFSQELHPSLYRLVNSPCLGRHRNFLLPWISEPMPFHKMCFMSLLHITMCYISSSNKFFSHAFLGFLSAIGKTKTCYIQHQSWVALTLFVKPLLNIQGQNLCLHNGSLEQNLAWVP